MLNRNEISFTQLESIDEALLCSDTYAIIPHADVMMKQVLASL